MDCVVAGWSIPDWLYEIERERLGFTKLKDLRVDLKNSCPSLAFLQDLANARKHNDITKYVPIVKSVGRRDGAFSSSFGGGFDVSRLYFETESGEFQVRDALRRALTFFDRYFDDHGVR